MKSYNINFMIKKLTAITLTSFLLLIATTYTFSFWKPRKDWNILPNYDIRLIDSRLSQTKGLSIEQKEAERSLKARVKDGEFNLKISWNLREGIPHFIHAYGTPLTFPSNEDPAQIALNFLRDHLGLFRLKYDDLSELKLVKVKKDKVITQVEFKQTYSGLDVFNAGVRVNINNEGRIISVASDLYPDIRVPTKPVIDVNKAIELGAINANIILKEEERVFITPQLVIFPTNAGGRLAWQMEFHRLDKKVNYLILIDALDGKLLYRVNRVFYLKQGKVYEESPIATYPPFGNARVIKLFDGSAVSNNSSVVSPLGWMTDTASVGNNIDAREDYDGNWSGGFRASEPTGNLDFPIDLFAHPTTYTKAAITNAFWFGNLCHDWFYDLGFDEPSGNFQANNFGRGGFGNDSIFMSVQDLTDTDNAYFAPYGDGTVSYIGLFLWTFSSPYRDCALDGDVVIHEYTHGLSCRLVDLNALWGPQSGAMGEGWSDWYPATLYDDDPTDINADAVMAEYSYNNPLGIRRYPYSTNMSIDPLTYEDYTGEVHDDGEIWCVTLWEMYKQLVQVYGLDTDISEPWRVDEPYDGRERAWLIVTLAMKLSPRSGPNMLEMRDAILSADSVLFGGANREIIWRAFAKRGMGYSASSPYGDSWYEVEEAFNLPPDLATEPYLRYLSYRIIDSTGNNDSIADPGELIVMPINLKNDGKDAYNITGILSSSCPYVIISVNNVSFSDITANGIGQSLSPHFVWTSAPDTPNNTIASFSLYLRALYGNGYEYETTQIFRVQIGGYRFCTTEYNWIDARSGTKLTLGDDDSIGIPIGFNFEFYGRTYSTITISSNGYLTFGDVGNEYYNLPIPNVEPPNNIICPFWDDLSPNIGGSVYYLITGEAPNRKLVVEWYQVPHYYQTGAATFEVILYETSNKIVFQYQDVYFEDPEYDYGASATIGIEDETGTRGLLFSYNRPSLSNETAICICPGLPPQAFLPCDIDIQPQSIEKTVVQGSQQQDILKIHNVVSGASTLFWTISESLSSTLVTTGGPDAFGYRWVDSDTPGGPVYNWIDITAIGTEITGLGDDTNVGPFPIGFSFPFYGNNFTEFRLCSNGWISFTSNLTNYYNTTLPDVSAPKNLIAPFWDDLDFSSGGRALYYSDGDRLIISYIEVPDWIGTGTFTFQIILYKSGEMVFQYKDLTGSTNSCTVGIQDNTGTRGLQIAYNQNYLHNNMAIRIFKEADLDWLEVNPKTGLTVGGYSSEVSLILDASRLPVGDTTGYLIVESNDPDEPILAISVRLHVIPNLLINGDFSFDTSGWQYWPFGGAINGGTWSWESTFLGQNGVLKLSQIAGEKMNVCQLVSLETGRWYTLEAKVATDISDIASTQKVYAFIGEYSAPDRIKNTIAESFQAGNLAYGIWTTLGVSFYSTSTQVGVSIISIVPQGASAGNLYIDDVKLYERTHYLVSSELPIENPGFDTDTNGWYYFPYANASDIGSIRWDESGYLAIDQSAGDKLAGIQWITAPAGKEILGSLWIFSSAPAIDSTQKVYVLMSSYDSASTKIISNVQNAIQAGNLVPYSWAELKFASYPKSNLIAPTFIVILPSGRPDATLYIDECRFYLVE